MNDDFLYRLRTEPPPHFADALKERLDRGSKRVVRVWHFGLVVLLFGTAFAMVSPAVRLSVAAVIDRIRGVPTVTVDAPEPANQGVAGVLAYKEVEAPDTSSADVAQHEAIEDAVKEGVLGLLEIERLRRARLSGVPLPALLTEVRPATDASSGTDPGAEPAGDAASPEQSDFIVTGPLLAEPGTPAYMFDTRHAYFTVMAWCMKPLEDILLRRAPIDLQTARSATYRLVVLTPMLSEMFAKDERGSGVATLARGAIWDQRLEFLKASQEFGKSMQGLLAVVNTDNEPQLRQAITRVELACSSCHEKFREGGNENIGAVTP